MKGTTVKKLLIVIGLVSLSAGAYALRVQPVQTPSLKVEVVKTQATLKVEPAAGVNYNPQGSAIRLQGN